MNRLLILITLMLMPSIADAGCGYQQSYNYGYQSYQQPYVPTVATFLGIPLYSVTFVAPAVTTTTVVPTVAAPVTTVAPAAKVAQDPECKGVAELKQRIASLEKLLAARNDTAPQQMDKIDNAQDRVTRVFQAKCAACHDKSNAAEKGHGFVMMDGGKLVSLEAKSLDGIVRKTYVGQMPPRKSGLSLDDSDRQAIEDWLDSLQQGGAK